jgi:2',3'-cyclic-nucleotide 2'-phosphodiesterase (5'-nucleotidase family)
MADLAAARQRSGITLLSTNVRDAVGNPFPGVPDGAVLDVKTERRPLRIGLLALTLDSTKKTDNYAKFLPIVDEARRRVEGWRQDGVRLDAVIALTHQSLADDEKLARAVPGIDLIVGGHEHENGHRRPLGVGGLRGGWTASIYRADSNARTVYLHELVFDAHTLLLQRVHSRLQAVTDAIPEDEETARVVKEYMERGDKAFRSAGLDPKEVLGETTVVLDGRESEVRSRATHLTAMIGDAMLHALPEAKGVAGTVAVYNSGAIRIDDRIPPGKVSMYEGCACCRSAARSGRCARREPCSGGVLRQEAEDEAPRVLPQELVERLALVVELGVVQDHVDLPVPPQAVPQVVQVLGEQRPFALLSQGGDQLARPAVQGAVPDVGEDQRGLVGRSALVGCP